MRHCLPLHSLGPCAFTSVNALRHRRNDLILLKRKDAPNLSGLRVASTTKADNGVVGPASCVLGAYWRRQSQRPLTVEVEHNLGEAVDIQRQRPARRPKAVISN